MRRIIVKEDETSGGGGVDYLRAPPSISSVVPTAHAVPVALVLPHALADQAVSLGLFVDVSERDFQFSASWRCCWGNCMSGRVVGCLLRLFLICIRVCNRDTPTVALGAPSEDRWKQFMPIQ